MVKESCSFDMALVHINVFQAVMSKFVGSIPNFLSSHVSFVHNLHSASLSNPFFIGVKVYISCLFYCNGGKQNIQSAKPKVLYNISYKILDHDITLKLTTQ